jgi:hypothetical protein
MNFNIFSFKTFLALVVLCLAFAAAFVIYLVHSWSGSSSFGLDVSKDIQLVTLFQGHRAAFEKLHQMGAEDLKRGWYLGVSDFGDGMRFIFAGDETSAIGPGWIKGIEYVPGSYETNGAIYGSAEINGSNYQQQWQGIISANLDNTQTLPAHVYLRQIESNWFIFYQRSE